MSNYVTGHAIGVHSSSGSSANVSQRAVKYDTVTFYGGSNGAIIDKVYGTNDVITQETVEEYSTEGKELHWETNAYLMCWFEDTLNGGNVSSIETPVTNWNIYRIDSSAGNSIKLAEIPVGVTKYVDYTALCNHTYEYWIIGSNDTEASSPIVSDPVKCDYVGWFVIDPEKEQVFAFNLNDDGGSTTSVENVHEYTTDGQYNVYSRGNTRFMKGTVSAILYERLDDFEQSVEFLDKFRDLIYSDRVKYVKDRKGRIYKATLSGYSETQFSHDAHVPMNISFSFSECGSVNG